MNNDHFDDERLEIPLGFLVQVLINRSEVRPSRSRPGLRQSSAAFGTLLAHRKAPEGWRSPKPDEILKILGVRGFNVLGVVASLR